MYIWLLFVIVSAAPPTTRCVNMTCMVWGGDDPDDLLDVLRPGFTLAYDPCNRTCTTACTVPLLDMGCTVVGQERDPFLIDVNNITVTSMFGAAKPILFVRTLANFQEASGEDYPCASFVISSSDVIVSYMRFDPTGCATEATAQLLLTGQTAHDAWIYRTPIVVLSEAPRALRLTDLRLLGGGDAVTRVVPSGSTADLNGAVFTHVVGFAYVLSGVAPVPALVPGVVVGDATGTITVNGTVVYGMGGSLVGATFMLAKWVGTDMPFVAAKRACVCAACPDIHASDRKHCMAMFIVIGIVSGIVFISIIIGVVYCLHKAHQKRSTKEHDS